MGQTFRLGAHRALVTFCTLLLLGRASHAEEQMQDPRIAVADRYQLFRDASINLEDLFATGVPVEEGRDYIHRLRNLTTLLEASLTERSVKIDLLQRKLQRARARMGGTVEVVGNDGKAAYSALEYRLRREEAGLIREINSLMQGGSNE